MRQIVLFKLMRKIVKMYVDFSCVCVCRIHMLSKRCLMRSFHKILFLFFYDLSQLPKIVFEWRGRRKKLRGGEVETDLGGPKPFF